jgi:uncharacterized RDD family membrane protein YckC
VNGIGWYAGFFTRFVAYIIDSLVLLIPELIAVFVCGSFSFFIIMGISWLYFSLMESSDLQATLGKTAMGIVVTDLNGNKISFGKATGRYFSKYISAIILLIGYIIAAFDGRKQALHDKIAGTLVCQKVVWEATHQEANSPAICPNCYNSNPTGTVYCRKCGTKIGTPNRQCPKCGRAFTPDTMYCPDCGVQTK